VPIMAVFCSSLISCFPSMLLSYCLNDFEVISVAPVIAGVTSLFTFHMRCIFIVRYLYFRFISPFFLDHDIIIIIIKIIIIIFFAV
jgi:hypothetical protein